jgi:Uma2 family endonuclease
MSTVAKRLITAAEFRLMPNPPDGSKQELVRGEIITMPPPGFRHGVRQISAASLLHQYAVSSGRGRVTVETGVVTEVDPDSVRGPDVSFWSYERLPAELEPEGYPDVAPDLIVEVLSPHDRRKKMLEKVRELLARGVRMVWIIDPEDRTVEIYRSPDEGRILRENATLSGEDVLPGFSCKVADLFA